VARARGNGVGGADEDDFILVPKAFARQQLMARTSPEEADAIFVLARSDGGPAIAIADIEDELARRRHVENVRGAISVTSLAGLMATSLQASDLLTLLLAGMAAISVLVGGVGIVNVMLTNVAERRLEIGLKLALGAAPALVAAEFLAEAVVLAALGALLGLAGAEGLMLLLAAARGFDVTLTPSAAGLSLVLALVVGTLAGAWPADRASQLQPREILRDV
jgi:putative ABC transport system permease protein